MLPCCLAAFVAEPLSPCVEPLSSRRTWRGSSRPGVYAALQPCCLGGGTIEPLEPVWGNVSRARCRGRLASVVIPVLVVVRVVVLVVVAIAIVVTVGVVSIVVVFVFRSRNTHKKSEIPPRLQYTSLPLGALCLQLLLQRCLRACSIHRWRSVHSASSFSSCSFSSGCFSSFASQLTRRP